jgi:hypothetical protein
MIDSARNLDIRNITSMEILKTSNTNALDLLRGNINTLIDFMQIEQEHNRRQDLRLSILEECLEDQERKLDWLVGYIAVRLQN